MCEHVGYVLSNVLLIILIAIKDEPIRTTQIQIWSVRCIIIQQMFQAKGRMFIYRETDSVHHLAAAIC